MMFVYSSWLPGCLSILQEYGKNRYIRAVRVFGENTGFPSLAYAK